MSVNFTLHNVPGSLAPVQTGIAKPGLDVQWQAKDDHVWGHWQPLAADDVAKPKESEDRKIRKTLSPSAASFDSPMPSQETKKTKSTEQAASSASIDLPPWPLPGEDGLGLPCGFDDP